MPARIISLVACGAPLAARLPQIAAALVDVGHTVSVAATPSAMAWIDSDAVSRVVGHEPRVDYRSPTEPKRGPVPDAVAICPATFNSLNKVVAGISDTYAVGVMCEALGQGLPIVAVPMVNDRLWGHPAWPSNLGILERAGMTFVDIHTGRPEARPVRSGTGTGVTARFDPTWVCVAVEAALGGV
jgi:phosphopantothenoylcysteine decarboxylase